MDKQVQCPNCKTYKVESFKHGAVKFGVCCVISSLVCFYYFSLINKIAFIIITLLGVLCIVNGFRNSGDYTCKGCNFKFKVQ
jgi:putative Mn2+ efflux pump MntP